MASDAHKSSIGKAATSCESRLAFSSQETIDQALFRYPQDMKGIRGARLWVYITPLELSIILGVGLLALAIIPTQLPDPPPRETIPTQQPQRAALHPLEPYRG